MKEKIKFFILIFIIASILLFVFLLNNQKIKGESNRLGYNESIKQVKSNKTNGKDIENTLNNISKTLNELEKMLT